MNEQEQEDFYDREIAPLLLELAEKCQSNGLQFLAQVEWSSGDSAETVVYEPKTASVKTVLAYLAIKAHGNFDTFMNAILRYAKEKGHNSVYLHLLESQLANTGGG